MSIVTTYQCAFNSKKPVHTKILPLGSPCLDSRKSEGHGGRDRFGTQDPFARRSGGSGSPYQADRLFHEDSQLCFNFWWQL